MVVYRRRSATAWVLLLATLPSGLGMPTTTLAQALGPGQLMGTCYDLLVGPWTHARQLRADSIYIAPPSRVRFDTTRSERQSDGFLLVTPPRALPSVHRMAFWWPVGRDSVALLWSTGHSGVRMRLGGAPGDLRGEARAFWDFPRDPLTAAVTARRVPCNAPARPATADQRLVFRSVTLEGGDSVALGMALAAIRERADHLRGRTFRIRRAPTGAFAGATIVDVSASRSDTVWRLEVTYPGDTEFESLVSSFSRALGAPISRDTLRLEASDDPGSESVHWSNRTTSLRLNRSRLITGAWRINALLVDRRLGP